MSDLEIVTPRIDHRAEAKRNIQDKILTYLRGGATRRDAAAASGVSRDTLRHWMQENSAFSALVEEAEGECGALMAARLTAEARRSDGDWKAALAWLQRRRRDEWGDSIKTEISGPGGGPILVDDAIKRQAAEELSAWRKQMSDELQNMQNAPLTQPTCSITTE
jgi:hypothetical protein